MAKKKKNNHILYWIPRLLAIFFILFISLFALDVFEGSKSLLETFAGLFIHLIPTFILIALTLLAWKWEFRGGIAFILLALAFTLFFRTYKHPVSFFIVTFPVVLIGSLFLLNHYKKKRHHKKKKR